MNRIAIRENKAEEEAVQKRIPYPLRSKEVLLDFE